jgi:hypothetical protein
LPLNKTTVVEDNNHLLSFSSSFSYLLHYYYLIFLINRSEVNDLSKKKETNLRLMMNDFLSCCMFYNLCSRSKFLSQFVLSFDFRNSSRFFFFMYKHSNPCNPNQNTRYRQTRNPLKPCIKMGRSGPVYFTRGLGWTDLLGLNQPNPTRCPPLEVAYTQTFI